MDKDLDVEDHKAALGRLRRTRLLGSLYHLTRWWQSPVDSPAIQPNEGPDGGKTTQEESHNDSPIKRHQTLSKRESRPHEE